MFATIWSVIKTLSGIPAFYELVKEAIVSWNAYRLGKNSNSANKKADEELDQRELEDLTRDK